MTRSLTDKEQRVVDAFEAAQPGLGEFAKRDILNPNSGWAERIAEISEEALTNANDAVQYSSNSFMYRRIGG